MEDDTESKLVTLMVPNYSNNLLVELYRLRQKNICCDVRISTDDGFVSAHKIVMWSASPYFRERLSLTEKYNEDIQLEDTSHYLINCLVEFLYTGTLHIGQDFVKPMMNLLNVIQLKDVTILPENSIKSEINMDKVDKTVNNKKEATISEQDKLMKMSSLQLNSDASSKRPRKVKPSKVVRNHKTGSQSADKDENESIDLVPRLTISFRKNDTTTWQSEVVESSIEDVNDDSKELNKSGRQCRSRKENNSRVSNVTESQSEQTLGRTRLKHKLANEILSKVRNETIKTRARMFKVSKRKPDKKKRKLQTKHNVEDISNSDKAGGNSIKTSPENSDINAEPFEKDLCNDIDTKDNSKVKTDQTGSSSNSKQCQVCEMAFPSQKTYLLHMKTHKQGKTVRGQGIKEKYWPCTVCEMQLSSLVRQACHQYSKHGIPYDTKLKLHTCTYEGCKYITASKHYLQIHTCRHGNERPHVCEYCGKGFKLPSALITHLNIHTNKKKYDCEECDMTFNQKGGLDIHIKKHHKGQQSWSELCHLCSEKFLHKAELCWHMFTCHGVPVPERYKVFTCDLCDYKTIRKNKLERHMDSHENNRSWVCTVCGKKFVTKSYLNRHVKYHGEKSFECDFEGCNYACVDHVGLKKHIRLMHTHKNYKPFGCTMCTYKTGLRGNLDKHIRTVHNLEVVTKHTVHLKMKFKDRRSGDIITKDGKLVQSANPSDSSDNPKHFQTDEEDDGTDINNELATGRSPLKRSRKTVKNVHEQKSEDGLLKQNMLPSSNSSRNIETPALHKGMSTDMPSSSMQQQQLLYLPNQNSMNIAGHVPIPFPMTTTSRMQLPNQMATNQSGMFVNVDPITSFKFQEFYD